MKCLNVLTNLIPYQNLRLFECIIKKHEKLTDKPPIQIYVNWFQNRITFKIKIGYYLELLTSETMNLLGSTKRRLAKTRTVGVCHT